MTEPLHPEETITSLYLIRHGHTQATEEGRLYTDPEAPLTDRGRQQAESLAAWLSAKHPDVLLSSPATRVRSTADIIAAAIGQQPAIVEGLNEWHVGDWEGKSYWEIKEAEPDLYKRWSEDPIHNAPPGGESVVDLCRRVKGQLDDLLAAHHGKRAALVTHAGVIRGILVAALSIPPENFWRLSVPTGSVSKVDFSENFALVHYLAFRPDQHKG